MLWIESIYLLRIKQTLKLKKKMLTVQVQKVRRERQDRLVPLERDFKFPTILSNCIKKFSTVREGGGNKEGK
jgi:hypothetical protein